VDEERPERRSPAGDSSAQASRALADRIAAASGAVPEPTLASRPDSQALAAYDESRRRLLLVGLAAAAALLLLALVASTYLAFTNKSRADDWEGRTRVLERHIDGLNGLLVERSNLLDARTRELNRMASTVERQQSALDRSEADVSTLEQRQRELANEKAQLEDSRAQLRLQASRLEEVAGTLLECKDGLIQLLGYIVAQNYGAADAIIGGVGDDCRSAEQGIAAYNATYP
jgi:uncharacterized coiled-coil protein SlyX